MATLLCCNANLEAQWEEVFGATASAEEGFDVIETSIPCNSCSGCALLGGDFVAVGVTDPFSSDKDLYVIRYDITGAVIWEKTIDLHGGDDIAYGVVEDLRGDIVIVGTTDIGASFDAFLLRLRCDGTIDNAWNYFSAAYPDNYMDEAFYEVDFKRSGATNTYDYVVAGYTDHPNDNQTQALLARLDSTGGIVWGKTYHISHGPSEVFYSLDTIDADIVAGGYEQYGNEKHGYAVRVNAANGTFFGGAKLGSGVWGVSDGLDDEIQSIIRLENPAESGAVAMTGLTQGNDILLSRVNNGDFSFAALTSVDYAIAVPGPTLPGPYGIGYEIIEARNFAYNGGDVTQRYDLAITGKTTYSGSNYEFDAFLFTYRNPFNLGPPIATISNRFGGGSDDIGWSLIEARYGSKGWNINGTSFSDLANTSDAGDLYLVYTLTAGQTDCDIPASELAQDISIHGSVVSTIGTWGHMDPIDPTVTNRDWGDLVCGTAPKSVPGDSPASELAASTLLDLSGGTSDAVPSTLIRRGESLRLRPHEPGAFDLIVSDVRGVVVATTSANGDEARLETGQWSPGLYLVRYRSGDRTASARIIISE